MSGAGPFRLGLLGHPVAHSVSPAMHEAALRAANLSGSYSLFDVLPGALGAMLERLRTGELHGLNVTVPHKGEVAGLCDRLAPEAALAGAVNTLVRAADGRIEGHNTDIAGLASALQSAFAQAPWRGGCAVVLGAGGAGRAAVLAAFQAGAAEVRVYNRTAARAERLVAELAGRVSGGLRATSEIADGVSGAALILQATTRGMATTPGTSDWLEVRADAESALRLAAPDAAVLDLVYRPRETPWVAAARRLGLAADDGLEMLVQQAAWAFKLWTGHLPAPALMRAAAEGALQR
ncbi:MAG: shikimate dehydrogenase [Myxococcota bacterium]